MRILFLLFLIVPIVEMLVLIEVGSFIGAFYTVLLVLLTAIIGVSLLKKQGLSTFLRANQKMRSGQMPVSEMGEGLMLAVAGALLLTPGFVTDTIGFILLTPGFRSAFAKTVAKKLLEGSQQASFYSQSSFSQSTYKASEQSNDFHGQTNFRASSPLGSRANEDDVVDGEFQEINEINPEKDK